jgi:hypothetical protein
MKNGFALGAALVLLATPTLAQYGGGAQNSGGPLGSYARSAGAGYGGLYGGYGYGPDYGAFRPAYSWGGPVYYGYPGYHPRRIYRRHARVYRRW